MEDLIVITSNNRISKFCSPYVRVMDSQFFEVSYVFTPMYPVEYIRLNLSIK